MPALNRIGAFFSNLVSEFLPYLKETDVYAKDMDVFFAMEEQYYNTKKLKYGSYEETPPIFTSIVFDKVSFKYPSCDEWVVHELDYTFEYGKRYALVGKNGCGKSKLVKLMLGLYKPDSGKITIDGINIHEMDFAKLQEYYSVVFQDFARYNLTVRDNITISRFENADDTEAILQATALSEIDKDIKKLSKGYDTMLGKLFEEGVDLSLGQWQKLVTARMFFSGKPFFILDEPTASLDLISESQLYTNYQKQMKGNQTSLFITHRLGATAAADIICVLDNGHISQSGSHKELMEQTEKLYYEMYTQQRGLYI